VIPKALSFALLQLTLLPIRPLKLLPLRNTNHFEILEETKPKKKVARATNKENVRLVVAEINKFLF